jgi:hypothetical protein
VTGQKRSAPFIAIYVEADEPAPCVFSTAARPREQRQLDAWLAENPALADLVDRAMELADAETEEP